MLDDIDIEPGPGDAPAAWASISIATVHMAAVTTSFRLGSRFILESLLGYSPAEIEALAEEGIL